MHLQKRAGPRGERLPGPQKLKRRPRAPAKTSRTHARMHRSAGASGRRARTEKFAEKRGALRKLHADKRQGGARERPSGAAEPAEARLAVFAPHMHGHCTRAAAVDRQVQWYTSGSPALPRRCAPAYVVELHNFGPCLVTFELILEPVPFANTMIGEESHDDGNWGGTAYVTGGEFARPNGSVRVRTVMDDDDCRRRGSATARLPGNLPEAAVLRDKWG
ncbi:hypothetical protein BC834DRAFT_1033001 [Gloeopeniophorella convolvens]|nr:hypothetical protein BC834DRAFT_1033001 [Gloeopeniophorella convolvens]